jgi:hypothetical protein
MHHQWCISVCTWPSLCACISDTRVMTDNVIAIPMLFWLCIVFKMLRKKPPGSLARSAPTGVQKVCLPLLLMNKGVSSKYNGELRNFLYECVSTHKNQCKNRIFVMEFHYMDIFLRAHLLDQWYSTRGTQRHLRGYVKYLCSFINFYITGNNIFVI